MNTTEIAVDDLLQIVKAYVNQNAQLKAVVAQQKQQIQQLQQQKEAVKKGTNENSKEKSNKGTK